MPADLNRVTIIGRLTRDPELRHAPGGDPVASMRIASNSRTRDQDGNWGDKPNFFDVTVFGRQAETVVQYMAKGRRIGVDGRLSWREWQAQDGTNRQAVEIVARDVLFLDSPGDAEAAGPGDAEAAGPGWSQAPEGDLPVDTSDMQPRPPSTPSGDDIPF